MIVKCIDEHTLCITEESIDVLPFFVLYKGMHFILIIKVYIIGFIFNMMTILINSNFLFYFVLVCDQHFFTI